MAWSEIPASKGALITADMLNEVFSAFNERAETLQRYGPGAIFPFDAVAHGNLYSRQYLVENIYWNANGEETQPPLTSWIQDLIVLFYEKSGSGNDTTFATWGFADLMTEALGVTDWPDKTERLCLSGHLNDIRTVLDTMGVQWVRQDDSVGFTTEAFYIVDVEISAVSAADVQAKYDAVTDEVIFPGHFFLSGSEAAWRKLGGNWLIEGIRDSHSISEKWSEFLDFHPFIQGTVPAADCYVFLRITNKEETNAPEQDLTGNIYVTTDEPSDYEDWDVLRAVGVLAGSYTFSGYASGSSPYTEIAVNIDGTKLTSGEIHYWRLTGKSVVNGELTDQTWDGTPREWVARADHVAQPIYVQYTFDFKAA